MAREFDSPGTSYEEVEELSTRGYVADPVIGIVGGATKGPRTLTRITNSRKLRGIFGGATDNDLGVYGAGYIIEEKCLVLYKRVMGKDANQGIAGNPEPVEADASQGIEAAPADRFTFKTRDYDSSLEGALISVKYAEDGTVGYKLTVNGKAVEEYKNLSLDPKDKKYMPAFMESIGSVLICSETEGVTTTDDVVLTMRGVDDGIASLSPEEYIEAAREFSNVDSLNVDMVIVPGVVDSTVQAAYVQLVRERGDCEYLPDIPFGTTPVTALQFVNGADGDMAAGFDEQQVSCYGPWVKINDIVRKKAVWTPPSVIAARVTAQSDRISGGHWFAASGFGGASDGTKAEVGRGVVPRAMECEYQLTKDDRDLWQGGSNILNPIVYFNGKGTAIFGNKTSKRTEEYEEESVYCSRHIRRMANYVRRVVIDVSLGEIFNPNDPLTWASWKARINPWMKRIKDGRGITDYKIVMDETTVTEDDIRNYQAPGIIYVKPLKALEFIPIKFTVTEDSVIFQDDEEEEV